MRHISALILCVAGPPLFAQGPERTHAVTPADYASVAAVTQLAVSPDGKRVAYCEARWDAADDLRKSDLWAVATDGKSSPRRLTADRANDRHPKWSVDGEAVYVLGNRKRAGETKPPYDGTTQVWRVKLVPVLTDATPEREGAEPQPVTRVPGGVVAFDYAPLGGAIFYSVDGTATDDDGFSKLRAKHKAEYGHGTRKTSAIWRLDVQSWRAEKVVDDARYVRDFAATRRGDRVAMITAPDDQVVNSEGKSRVDVWDKDSGKTTTTDMGWMKSAASPYPWLESLAWNAAGTRLAFCTIFDAFPAEVVFQEWRDGAWAASRMPRGAGVQVRGYGSPLKFLPPKRAGGPLPEPDTLAFLGEAAGDVSVLFHQLDPKFPASRVTAKSVVVGFDEDPGRRTAAVIRSTAADFPQVAAWGERTEERPLTDANPQARTWQLPSVRHVTWKAADGVEVGGVLELPAGHKDGDKLPLVVAIHGGPTTASKAELTFDPHNGRLYFAAAGYAVLCPNYRGSVGYGDKFVTDLIGRENDVEVDDIIAGVQHLIKQGVVDSDRIGVMGWSNGGYLTNCLITRKDLPFKLKAASSGAGIVDTVAEWGFNDEPAYPIVFKKGLPWETPDVYRKTSPTYALGNVTTPTLIHVGGGDERCPPGHSRMLYRALRENLKVPTELVVYPNEPHGLTKLSHRVAKMEWDLAWFDKYVRGK